MYIATIDTSNPSVLGGEDVAKGVAETARELAIDELVYVGGGMGAGGTK
jgi:hypothetical protein